MSNAGDSCMVKFYVIARHRAFVRGFRDRRIGRWDGKWYDEQDMTGQLLYEQGRRMAATAGMRMTREDLAKYTKAGRGTNTVHQVVIDHVSEWNSTWIKR